MEPTLVVPSLASTPRLLRNMTGDCSREQGWAQPKPGEWSIGEVVRHLVEGEYDAFLPRLKRMLAEERPIFDKRGGGTCVYGQDLAALVAQFEAVRGEAVKILESLDAAAWQRQGVSPSRGPVSIAEYAQTMAGHDIEHLRQIHDVRQTLGLNPKRCEARLALPLGEILAAIETGPACVRSLAEGLTAEQLRHQPRPGEWSMKEVMAHLLKVERDVFLPRLKRLASENRPVFESFDPDAWARERDHREGDFMDEWRGFAAARSETIALLRSAPPGAAERVGISGFFGPVSLGQYATHVVDHDLEHLAQLAACRAAAMKVA
jgi:uncharacterized damage-inducible protein DinB